MNYFNISSFERIVIPVATKSINIPRIFPCPDVKNNVKLFQDFDNTISGLIEIPITPDMISGDSMTSVRNGITINLPNNLVAGTYFVRVEFYSDMSYPLQKTAFDTTYYYESQFALVFTMLKRLEFLLEHTILIDNIDFVQKPLDWESNAILKWHKTQKLIENLSFTDKEEEILAGDQWVVARDEKGFVVSAVKVDDLLSVLTFLDSGDVGNVLFKTKNKDGDKIAECEFAPLKVENITDLDISEKRNDSRMSWIDGEYLMKKHDTTLFFPKKLDVTKPLYDKDSYELRKETFHYRLQSWYKEYRIICVKNNRENLNFVKTEIFIFNVGDIPEDCVSTFDISLIDLGVESNILLKDAFSIAFFKGINFSVPLFTTAGLFESEDASLIINLKVVFNSVGVLQVVQYGSGAGGDGGRPIREKVITFPSQINNELPIFDLNNYPVKVSSYNFSLSQEYFSNYNIFCVDNSNPATADDVTLTTINITNVNYIPFDAYSTFDITIVGLDGNTFLNRSFLINFYFFEISAFGIAFQFKPSDSNLGSNPICYSLVFSKNEIIKINDNSINSVNGSAVRNSLDVENPLMNILSVVNPVNKKTLLRYHFDEIIGQNYVTFPAQLDKTKPIEDFTNYSPRFNEFVFSLLNIKHLEMSFICVNNNGVGGAGGELLTDINIFNVSSIPSGKVFVCNFVIYQGNNLTTELGKAFTFNFYAGVDATSELLFTTFGEEYYSENGKISLRVCLNKYGATELLKYGSGGGGGGGGNFVTQTQFNQAVAQINETIIESADATLLSANDYTDEQIALIGGKEIWVNPTMPVTIWGNDNNAVKYVVSKELAIWVGIYTTVGLTNRTMIYKIDTRPMATWNNGDFYHLRLYVEVKRGDFFGALGGKFRVVDENNTVIVGDVDVIDRTDGGIAGVNGLILFSRVNGVSVIRPLPFSTFVNHSDPLIVDLAGYLTKDDAELLYAKITNVYSRVEADATFLNQLEFTGQGILDRLDTTNPVMNILGAVNPVNGQLVLQYNGNDLIGQNYVTFPAQLDNTKPIGDFTNYNPRFNEFTFSLLNLMYLEMSFVCVNNNGIGGAGIKTVTNVNFFNSGTIPSGKVFVGNIIIYQGNDTTTPLVEAFVFNFYAGVDATSELLFTTFGEVYQIVDGQISFRISVNKYGLVELDKYGSGGGGGVVDAPTIVNLSVENPQKNARLKINDDGSKFFVEVDGGGGGGSVIPSEIIDNATVLTENQKYFDWAFDSVSANLTLLDKKTFTPIEASLIMADYPRPVYALQDGKNLELKNLEFYALRNFEGGYSSGGLTPVSAYFRRFGIILDVSGLTDKFISVSWKNLIIGTGGGYYNGTLFPLATTTTNNYAMYKTVGGIYNSWYIWFNNNQSDDNIMFLCWENTSTASAFAGKVSDKLIVRVEDNKLFVNQSGWYYGSGAIQNIIPASRNYIGRADILVRNEFDKNIVCISKITILNKNWGWSDANYPNIYLSGAGLVGEIECVLRVMCGGYSGVYSILFNGSSVKTFNHPFINNIGIYDFPVRVSATKITFLTEPSFETILIQNIIQEVTNINNTIEESKVVELSSRKNSFIPSMLDDNFDESSFDIVFVDDGTGSGGYNQVLINVTKNKDYDIVIDADYYGNGILLVGGILNFIINCSVDIAELRKMKIRFAGGLLISLTDVFVQFQNNGLYVNQIYGDFLGLDLSSEFTIGFNFYSVFNENTSVGGGVWISEFGSSFSVNFRSKFSDINNKLINQDNRNLLSWLPSFNSIDLFKNSSVNLPVFKSSAVLTISFANRPFGFYDLNSNNPNLLSFDFSSINFNNGRKYFYLKETNIFESQKYFVDGLWYLNVGLSEDMRGKVIVLRYDSRFYSSYLFNDKKRTLRFFIYPASVFVNNATALSIMPDLTKGDFNFSLRFVNLDNSILEYNYAFKINESGTGFLNSEIIIEYSVDCGISNSDVNNKFVKYYDSYDSYRIKDLQNPAKPVKPVEITVPDIFLSDFILQSYSDTDIGSELDDIPSIRINVSINKNSKILVPVGIFDAIGQSFVFALQTFKTSTFAIVVVVDVTSSVKEFSIDFYIQGDYSNGGILRSFYSFSDAEYNDLPDDVKDNFSFGENYSPAIWVVIKGAGGGIFENTYLNTFIRRGYSYGVKSDKTIFSVLDMSKIQLIIP